MRLATFRPVTNRHKSQNVTQIVTQMNITFKYVLHSHVQKDGTQKIMLRITQNRTHKYLDIGYSIKAEDWNKEKSEVRKGHRLSAQIKMVMDAKLLEAQKTYLHNQAIDVKTSAAEIKKKLKREIVGDSYLDYADDYVSKMPNAGTQLARESVIKKLKDYLGKDGSGKQIELLFPEITYKFLKDYERYLRRIGNNDNTIGGNIKFLGTVYRDALKCKAYRTMDNPFLEYTLPKAKTSRTRLKEIQIMDIENYETTPGSLAHDARLAFLFSFYLQGMRVSDVLQLTWRNVKGDYLTYRASKTDKSRPRKLIARAKAILEYYAQFRKTEKDYIFPFLKKYTKSDYDPRKWVKVLDSKNSKIRNELMEIAHNLGFEKLSMHVARHSFANIARQKTGDVHIVSDALDHASIAVTESYFGAAEPEENDDLVKKVFGE